MATSGARGLQRKSLSSERAQRTIKSIEAQLGIRIGGDTSDNKTSEETSSEQELGRDTQGSVDKAD